MDIAESIQDVRAWVRRVRGEGRTIGFVPTMGNLHEGHLRLIDAALAACDTAVVSIFVNPTQFGPGEDFANYPRTLPDDLAACRQRGAGLVFVPSVREMYPEQPPLTEVRVRVLEEPLCGRYRCGHFTGVCTVVAKLLNIVAPDQAFFGAKDFQQTVVIRRMVTDLNLPVEIVVCPTVRESDGLAMSSRNQYLSADERAQAVQLHAALRAAAEWIRREHPRSEAIRRMILEHLAAHAPLGAPQYVEVVNPDALAPVERTDEPVLLALAVHFGKARLIDNILVESPSAKA